ncbi:uncharacterized protein LOC110461550 [Mizuhopecten yessoensis]|uniref:uncharacterized protein LOC110461550 n=1 Tax=Mizuhopecten yessoensis TaxID=6573 RepID=UPI000B45EC6C|nr:uncharacterized protein LOC110461550 [Mizuhopecten yessoensis]
MAETPNYSNTDQVLARPKAHPACRYHQETQLEFHCRHCDVLVCSECLSVRHKYHSVCKIGDIIPERKQDIKNLVERTENYELVKVREYIVSTETQLEDNDSYFEKLTFDLKTQTNKLKEDLDLLAGQTISIFCQMKEDNARLLQIYKQDLEIYETQLQQQLQESKTLLHRGTDIEVYHFGCTARYDSISPVKPILRSASFKINADYLPSLKQALGDMVTGKDQPSDDQNLSSVSSSYRSPQMEEESNESESSMSSHYRQSEMLPQAKVLKEYKTPRMISAMCHTIDGQVWISYLNSGSVALLDRTGLVKGVLRHVLNIKDISVSPATNALWACQTKDRSIMELVSGELVLRFKTKIEPVCMCVTVSNHVIVGMAKNISKFTTKGKVVLTTLATGTKKPLVCTPLKISECPVTNHVAVIDEDFKDHGGEGKRNVVVMDTDFQELFRYRGEIPTTCQHTEESESRLFICYGIGFDRLGKLIIGDHYNNRILLLSGRGDFLRVLHTDKFSTSVVSVTRENVVFAVFNGDRVRLLQYYSK